MQVLGKKLSTQSPASPIAGSGNRVGLQMQDPPLQTVPGSIIVQSPSTVQVLPTATKYITAYSVFINIIMNII